jgi:uncharacterized RDD family membrane protein YckC
MEAAEVLALSTLKQVMEEKVRLLGVLVCVTWVWEVLLAGHTRFIWHIQLPGA